MMKEKLLALMCSKRVANAHEYVFKKYCQFKSPSGDLGTKSAIKNKSCISLGTRLNLARLD
jgi:hypothetical protein